MAFKMKGMSFGNSPVKNYKKGYYGEGKSATPMNSPVKQKVDSDFEAKGDKSAPGHGGDPMPDVLYTADGTLVPVSQIDEELLDLEPSVDPKGKYVNYTDDVSGEVTKYYYKKP